MKYKCKDYDILKCIGCGSKHHNHSEWCDASRWCPTREINTWCVPVIEPVSFKRDIERILEI
jgi:hypothetical protein